VVRKAVEYLIDIIDVDRRTNLDRGRYDRDWPVTLSVPVTPVEYDALRFLSSMYPANPSEIVRASVLRTLDPGAIVPSSGQDGLDKERTARVELNLEVEEARRLEDLAKGEGVVPEVMARWAMTEALGSLLDVPRTR
jgi:hypothetical protein